MAPEKTLFEKFYEVGEENLARMTEEFLSNPVFSEAVRKTLRNAAETKGKVDENIAVLLGILNLPSKADYNRLLAKVETLQGSLVNLNIKLDRLLAMQTEKPKTPSKATQTGRTNRTRRTTSNPFNTRPNRSTGSSPEKNKSAAKAKKAQ